MEREMPPRAAGSHIPVPRTSGDSTAQVYTLVVTSNGNLPTTAVYVHANKVYQKHHSHEGLRTRVVLPQRIEFTPPPPQVWKYS